jgi:flagellar motility protein MotE (MotC chaperone)
MSLRPWPRRRPRPMSRRPMSRRAMVAPALLATIGVLAAAKFALLAHGAVRALSAPAALETPVVAGKAAAGPDMEPAAGPGENTAAAGAPERAAAPPAPQPTPARVATGPAPRLALDRLSQSEIEVLQQLAARRAALDRREQELDRRAALLATAEANVGTQLERLEQLRAEIAATMATHDAKEDEKLASLVKIYETMKPKAAAEIFDRLEMPILIRVVERMRAPKSADVLARMDPAKAKQVTAELARRTELLRAAGNG